MPENRTKPGDSTAVDSATLRVGRGEAFGVRVAQWRRHDDHCKDAGACAAQGLSDML